MYAALATVKGKEPPLTWGLKDSHFVARVRKPPK